MGINEIFILITIVISFMAILVANDKKLVLYKFNICILIPVIFCFLLINYLVFFDSAIEKGLYFQCLMTKNGIYASTWAYIITIAFLIVFFLYVEKCEYFPSVNNDKIIRYYKSLINTNKVGLLMSYIEKYHKRSILREINQINALYKQDTSNSVDYWHSDEVKNNDGQKNDKKPLSIRLLEEVFANKNFITESIKVDPLFYIDITSRFTSPDFESIKESISYYIQELIRLKNPDFIEELYHFITDESKTIEEQAKNTRFLKYLFKKEINWIKLFDIEMCIGEYALREIEEEQNFWNIQPNEYRDYMYKHTAARIYLRFYYCIFRYLIEFRKLNNITDRSQRVKDVNYLFYISKALVNKYDCEGNTYATKLFEDIKCCYMDLFQYLFEKETNDLVDILVNDQWSISKTNNTKYISENGLRNVIVNFMQYYSKDKDNPMVEAMVRCFQNKKDEMREQYTTIRNSICNRYSEPLDMQVIDDILK